MSAEIQVKAIDTVNFAYASCKGNIVESVAIDGCAGKKAVLRIFGQPEFIYEYRFETEITSDHYVLDKIELNINHSFWRREVVEAVDATLTFEVQEVGEEPKTLCTAQHKIHLQPYLQWDNKKHASLTCFMQPNDALVSKVLCRAGELANAEGKTMCGYQSKDVYSQVKWIYQALCEVQFHYFCPPAGYFDAGQKVRIPAMVLDEKCKQGTCLDLAVLFATCLEATSLNSVIFLIQGHAFAGVWLEGVMLNDTECTSVEFVKESLAAGYSGAKLVMKDSGCLLPIECTLMTDGKNVSFEAAVVSGLKDINPSTFEYMLDVTGCRNAGYVPVFTAAEKPNMPANPALGKSIRKLTKLQRLQRQAMDLTMRNRLIGRKMDEKTISFRFPAENFFLEEYAGNELCIMMHQNAADLGIDTEALDNALFGMMKADAQARRDFGRGVAYLTLNALEWNGTEETQQAPIYLVPLEVYRNLRGEYFFDCQWQDCVLNPALKELLHGDYNIDISEMLACPGKEYKAQMSLLKQILEGREEWTIVEDLYEVGVYQMPNEAIYNGLCDEDLPAHDIVKGILDEKMSWDNSVENTEEISKTVLYPFAADSSQRKVIQSLYERRGQVIFGPAGNGKSQTITNILTDKMQRRKAVLFIAEKPSAQEVIYDKLTEIGLDKYCLYLPDGKKALDSIKQCVEDNLRSVSDSRSQKFNAEDIAVYEQEIEKLINYHEAFREENPDGETLTGLLAKCKAVSKRIPLAGCPAMDNPDEIRDLVKELSVCLTKNLTADSEAIHKLKNLDADEETQKKVLTAINNAQMAESGMKEAETALILALGLYIDCETEEERRIVTEKYIKIFLNCPEVGPELPISDKRKPIQDKIRRLAGEMMCYTVASKEHDEVLRKLRELKEELKKLSEEDDSYGDLSKPQTYYRMNPLRPSNGGFYKEETELMQKNAKYQEYEKKALADMESRPEDEKQQMVGILRLIGKGEAADQKKAMREYQVAKQRLQMTMELAENLALASKVPDSERTRLFVAWKNLSTRWEELQPYFALRERAAQQKATILLDRIEKMVRDGELKEQDILPAFEATCAEKKFKELIQTLPMYSAGEGASYQEYLEDIKEKENKAREALRKQIWNNVAKNMPNLSEGVQDNSELGAIQKMIRHPESNGTARELFEKAGGMLQQMFPCMIMSPAMAAECLAKEMPKFETVIFDEGSQLPTFKALIPISHADKCVVVGDEKQLTPTSFFQKNVEDEEGHSMKSESILEDAIITSMPQIMLKFHYRSKYESLVAFSNSRYYGNEIVTFPNKDVKFKGVECIYVEDGLYDRGGKRNNEKEAERVWQLIREIYEKQPKDTEETVGVITFNIEQKNLIEELIRKGTMDNSDISKKIIELVDVVNLEACQGKEWSFTILSTTYGYDKEGKFTGNMGPMSREEGKNRLNVMITRAKKYMYVVTSILPGMIEDSADAGLGDIRDFLSYASGVLKLDTKVIAEETDAEECGSAIEQQLAAKLRENGYTVHTGIGSSECKVNIGVADENGEEYKLGILLDDQEGVFDIVDHELMIPSVLIGSGWKIYRLASVNWFKDPELELRQIIQMMQAE